MKNIFAKIFGKAEAIDTNKIVEDAEKFAKVEKAYWGLVDITAKKKATKADLTAAIHEAIWYLGEVLEE